VPQGGPSSLLLMLEVKKNKITLMEKNARKIIDIFIIKHVDIRTAIILAGFIIDIDCVRLTDMECQNIAINYPYSYKTIRI